MFRNYSNYEVYPDGKIWSYSHKKFLKPATTKYGYQQVKLYDNEGKMKRYYLHRVVWESVTGAPIPKGYEINHISEAKDENFFANLELVSHKENINFGTRNDRIAKANTNGKCSKQVGAFKDGELVMTFPSTQEAGRNGFDQSVVSRCCNKCFHREGNNVYKGFEWRYI